MRPTDLTLLHDLDVLLAETNVTRAAARLATSQPALSARLARLRRLFNDPLLVPSATGRGMVATPRALALKGELHAALQRVAAVVAAGERFDPASRQRTLRIIANDNAAMMLQPAWSALLKQAGVGGVRLALLQPDARLPAERLEQGEADLALGFRAHATPGLIARALVCDRFQVAQRKRHPRGSGPVNLDGYCRYGHVMVSTDGGGFASPVDQALAAVGRKRSVVLSVPAYTLAAELIAKSDLLCTLPRRFLQRFGGRLDVFAPPLDLPAFRLAMIWHPRMRNDPAHVWLREQLLAAAK